jgi:hypothetical protein
MDEVVHPFGGHLFRSSVVTVSRPALLVPRAWRSQPDSADSVKVDHVVTLRRKVFHLLRKILKWFGLLAGVVAIVLGGWYIKLSSDAPPVSVTPGEDLLAAGSPSMPFPGGKEETFEPHVAIDPNDPNHIVVAAMYGKRFGRGGDDIYRWESRDGGQTWQGATVKALAFQGVFAADPVVAFDDQGRDHLTSLYANLKAPTENPALVSMFTKISVFFGRLRGEPQTPQDLMKIAEEKMEKAEKKGRPVAQTEGKDATGDVGVALSISDPASGSGAVPVRISAVGPAPDKEWMAIDNNPTSPYRGNTYVAWVEGEAGKAGIVMSTIRPDGKVETVGRTVVKQEAESYGPSITVRPSGRLDMVWFEREKQLVQHQYSDDGGKTFSKITDITSYRKRLMVDAPAIAAAPDGTVLACWTESTETSPVRTKCATTRDDQPWSPAVDIDAKISAKGMIGQPAVAASKSGLWVLAYKSDRQTDVVLYRSVDGGKSFSQHQILGSRTFGVDEMCIGQGYDVLCRFDTLGHKFNGGGDYIGLSAVGNRVAASFGLTLGNDPVQFSTIYTKVIDIP